MPEQQMVDVAHELESKIKIKLIERDMTQVELARLIDEGPQQVNRAIKGDVSPKAREIRSKIARVLNF